MQVVNLVTLLTIATPMMLCQLEDPSPIIAYKPQGVLKAEYPLLQESSFLLVLMTPFQVDVFRNFSMLSCLDSTHKTTQYGFKLITLVVPDEFRNGNNLLKLSHTCIVCSYTGVPVAWGIADIEDTRTYTEFFSAIKRRIPDAAIHILMTDNGTYNIPYTMKVSLKKILAVF